MQKAIVRIGTAALLTLVLAGLAAVLFWDSGQAGATAGKQAGATSVSGVYSSTLGSSGSWALTKQNDANDPRILAVQPIQSIADEPLILNKSTVVRVLVGSPATTTLPIAITAAVNFDGQQLSQTATLTQTQQYVDFYPQAPQQLRTISVSAVITAANGVTDTDKSNNSMQISVPTIQMPNTQVKIFYLPVDWSAEASQIGEFDKYFPEYVKENTDFVRATYPMPDDQVLAESTDVPHMLTESERDLADHDYNFNPEGQILFGGSIVLTARQYAPDAELIAAVLPPHWLQEHESRSALGFASSQFPGTTFVLLWGPDTMVIGHEYGHLRNLIDDYDFSGARDVTGYYVDKPGFWVAHKTAVANQPGFEVWNMMSSAAYNGIYNHFWIDSRSYDHLIANYISAGGKASAPLVLAATIAANVSDSGAPLFAAAGQNYWDPKDTVGMSVATIGVKKTDKIRVVWTREGQVIKDETQTAPGAQFAYTRFALKGSGAAGLPLGRYEVEVYLNDTLAKTARFFVSPVWVPEFNINLSDDNSADQTTGYHAGSGLALVTKPQDSMFIGFASPKQEQIYSWFVAMADGSSPAKDFNVDMKFIGPDGKEYQSEWVDDNTVTASGTLSAKSYARKSLKIAGTAAADQLGQWNVKIMVNGAQVATNTFSLLEQSGGTALEAATAAANALGYRLINIGATNTTNPPSVVMAEEPITQDLKSPEFIQQVWDSYKIMNTLYPDWIRYRLKMPVTERHNMYLELDRDEWLQLASQKPSWDTLRDQKSFAVQVRDDILVQFLAPEDAVKFLEDRLK